LPRNRISNIVGHRAGDLRVAAQRGERDDQRPLGRARLELAAKALVHELVDRAGQADVRLGKERVFDFL
jgi:hypothetical protein